VLQRVLQRVTVIEGCVAACVATSHGH